MFRFVIAGILAAGAACAADATFNRDILPILQKNCQSCHRPGEIGPMSLLSYKDVRPWVRAIESRVSAGTMPPWHADPSINQFQNDRRLDPKEKQTLLAWIANGAPEGDPADARTPVDPSPAGLSRVDRVLQLSAAYAPVQAPDEYRCFLLDWPETERRYVTGFAVRPGDPGIVHHVLAFLATPDRVADFQALDDADPGPGYACFGGPGGVAQALAAWAPGSEGGDFPADTGLQVDPGSRIILQIHYNLTQGQGASDRTSIELKLDGNVSRQAFLLPWANPQWINAQSMRIPAGAADVTYAFTFAPGSLLGLITGNRIPSGAFTVYAAALHQHLRGTRSRLDIVRRGGTRECVLDIPRWDFHWQGAYTLAKPKRVETADSLSIECHWDNSAANQPDGLPPRDLNWGERTQDEMCLGFLYITP